MRSIVLDAIRLYQRHLSPHKGFCCAYRQHTGRQSCSALGLRAVRRYGVLAGLAVLRRRLRLCGVAHRRFSPPRRRPFRHQRGDCDIGCDLPCDGNCDLPGSKACGTAGEVASYCDCGGCDGSDKKRKADAQEQSIHIPPFTRFGKKSGP